MSVVISKPTSDNKILTVVSPFALDSVEPTIFRGYPEAFDSSRYFCCEFNTTLAANTSTANWQTYDMPFIHCPGMFDEDSMDIDYYDINSNITYANNTGLHVFVKVNIDGLITAIKVRDEIVLGSAFVDDPDWKLISTSTMNTGVGYNSHVPLLCFSNALTSYIYLLTYYVPVGETKIKFQIMDLAYASDSETQLAHPTVSSSGFNQLNSVNDPMFEFLKQNRDNVLLVNLFNNARFIVR